MPAANPSRDHPRALPVVGVVGLTLAFLLVGMAGGSHFDSDDALYAQMAREMVRSGDFVDNRWSGVVLFEKPPLYLWALASSGALFGWGEWAMRLPGTLFAALAVGALFGLSTGLGATRRQARVAAGLRAGSTLFVLLSRRLMMDVPLLAATLAAAAAMVHGRWWWFGALSGAAVLIKGPAALPLLLAVVLGGLWTRRLTGRGLAQAVAVGLLVAAPWHLAVTLRHGTEFWSGYVGHHVAERASSNVVPGLSVAQVLEVLAAERLLLLAGALGFIAALGLRIRGRALSPLARFASVWLVFALLPVLLSTTRLPHYLLPVMPALALLAVAAIPPALFAQRLAPLVGGVAVLAAFAADPAALTYWLDPDFGPEHKRLGETIAQHAEASDQVAAYNTTTAALTFYADRPVLMTSDDPRFNAVQQAVLMVRRSGLHHPLTDPGFPETSGRRFVVARKTDLQPLAARLASSGAGPLSAVLLDRLVLVNDAGVGTPLGNSTQEAP